VNALRRARAWLDDGQGRFLQIWALSGLLLLLLIALLGSLPTLLHVGIGPFFNDVIANGGPVLVVGLVASLTAVVSSFLGRVQRRATLREREIATRTAEAVAEEIGVSPELVATTAPTSVVVGRAVDLNIRLAAQPDVQAEVDRRVEAAMQTFFALQEAAAKPLEERVRAIEAKFPEAGDLQKYATAQELFLGLQIGELSKRLDRLESKQLGRLEVIGIVTFTLVAAVAVVAGLFEILKVVGLLPK
jgi:hypothetical protein